MNIVASAIAGAKKVPHFPVWGITFTMLLFLVMWGLAEAQMLKYKRLETPLRVHAAMHYVGNCELNLARGAIDLARFNTCVRGAKDRANEEVDNILAR